MEILITTIRLVAGGVFIVVLGCLIYVVLGQEFVEKMEEDGDE